MRIGLHGRRRRLDLGRINGERFAVMAGVGFDARMIRDADRGLKDRVGRLAYIATGAKNLRGRRVRMRIDVDGDAWFDGDASCVLFANVGTILGGIEAFEHARPDDGRLEVGVVTAEGAIQWIRALGRTALGDAEKSPFVQITSGKKIDVRLSRPSPYELDGGDRADDEAPEGPGRAGCRDRLRRGEGGVSTATAVPETWELTGDDARETLLHTGRRKLVRDAFLRLRAADGFSHARSLAFALALVLVQAIIALVGLAAALGKGGASDVIVRSLEAAAPGPAGDLLTSAVSQAHEAGASNRYLALSLGLLGAIVTGTTLMGQFERALNRLYGIEAGPAVDREVRPRIRARDHGRCSRRPRVRVPRVRSRRRRRPRGQPDRGHLGGRAVAARAAAHDGRDGVAVPVVTAAASAAMVVARVRCDDLRAALVCGHARRWAGSSG